MRLAGVCVLALAGCARGPAAVHVPPYASQPYVAFSRDAVVAVALREWRLFGSPMDDDMTSLPRAGGKPEREAGLWQRVGDYWWQGVAAGHEQGWTGKHDETGTEFAAGDDGRYAWSAAFVSYVMRVAGAGSGFPYAAAHAAYINAAVRGRGGVLAAERPEAYAPAPGDLICTGRGTARDLTFDDLPTDGDFPGHCDIVVAQADGIVSVIGGNVDDAVTMKHVPTTADGRLASPDGTVIDTRYPWLCVLRVRYPAAPLA